MTLLASTGILALGLAVAPVAVDSDSSQPAFPAVKSALANSSEDNEFSGSGYGSHDPNHSGHNGPGPALDGYGGHDPNHVGHDPNLGRVAGDSGGGGDHGYGDDDHNDGHDEDEHDGRDGHDDHDGGGGDHDGGGGDHDGGGGDHD